MAEAKLDILLKADVDQATKAIKKFVDTAEKEVTDAAAAFDDLDDEIKQVGDSLKKGVDPKSFDALVKQVRELKDQLESLKKVKIPDPFTPLKAGAVNATPALTNLGRVIQDAPFGIIGIANNIDPLLDSFQRLKTQSGSVGGALKALGSAFLGPAGIAIGVSAITSALIAFGPQIKNFINGVSKAAQETQKFKQEYEEAFSKLAGKETTTLDQLRQTIEDVNKPNETRIRAIKELRQLYPTYFADLSNEALLAGNVGNAYTGLTAQILKSAKARTAVNKVAEISGQLLTVEEQRAKVLGKTNEELAAVQAKTFEAFSTSIGGAGGGGRRVSAEEQKELARNAIIERRNAALADLGKRETQLNNLAEFYNKIAQEGVTATQNLTTAQKEYLDAQKKSAAEAKKASEAVSKESIQAYNDAIKQLGVDTITLTKAVTTQGEEYRKLQAAIDASRLAVEKKSLADKAAALISATSGTQVAPDNLAQGKTQPKAITDEQTKNLQLSAEAQQQLADATANTNAAFSLLSPAIDQAFNALANGQDVGESVAQAIKQLVVQLVKAVVQAAILSAILSAISGGTTTFGSSFLKILGFKANGGPVSGGSPYIVGDDGPELFIPGTSGQVVPNMALQGSGGGVLTATVSGSDLLFVLNRANDAQRRIYG